MRGHCRIQCAIPFPLIFTTCHPPANKRGAATATPHGGTAKPLEEHETEAAPNARASASSSLYLKIRGFPWSRILRLRKISMCSLYLAYGHLLYLPACTGFPGAHQANTRIRLPSPAYFKPKSPRPGPRTRLRPFGLSWAPNAARKACAAH